MRHFAPIVLIVAFLALAIQAVDLVRSSALAPPRPLIDAIEPPLPTQRIEARQAPAAAIVTADPPPVDRRFPQIKHGDGW